jgi:hypothetical protein
MTMKTLSEHSSGPLGVPPIGSVYKRFCLSMCCTRCMRHDALSCRPSTGACDPQEVCNGQSAACPADVKAPDNTMCALKKDL